MDLPSLRHFRSEGIYTISSDPVEALIGEAWVPARYTDRGWATADGSTLLSNVEDWRYAVEERQTTKTSNSNRVRKIRKKPQAQAEG